MTITNFVVGTLAMYRSRTDHCVPCSTPTDTPADGAVIGSLAWGDIVTVVAALIGAVGVIITLLINSARARRDFLASLFADALAGVADYLEGPYRILRKDGTAGTRFAITSHLSDVKVAIDRHQELLRLHAPTRVSTSFDAYVHAAKVEAGRQMKEAWRAKPITKDRHVNLGTPLPRERTNAARLVVVEAMQTALERPWWKPRPRPRRTKR